MGVLIVVTQRDINNDLRMLADSIDDDKKELVSPLQALKISMTWPMSYFFIYAISIIWLIYSFEPHLDHFDNMTTLTGEYGFIMAAGAVSLLFSTFIGLGFYGPALAYLSIGKDARSKSMIVKRLKGLIFKFGFFFLVCNFTIALVSIKIPIVLAASPVMVSIPFLIIFGVVSAEATRYGIGPVLGRLNELSKKL